MRVVRLLVSILIAVLFMIPAGNAAIASPQPSAPRVLQPGQSLAIEPPIPAPPGRNIMAGYDIRVTNSVNSQNEITIAINPKNQYNIIMGANDYRGWDGNGGASWCGIYTTMDGGAHWNMGLIPRTGALSWDTSAGDPSVAFDTLGNAYFACLGFVRTAGITNNTIAISKSVDGGLTWQAPVNVVSVPTTPPFHDKPYIATDLSFNSVHRNNIYISWTNFSSFAGGPAPIYFSRSTDGGASFSPPAKISGNQLYCQGSQPSVGPQGEVYVSFLGYAGATRLYVTRSLDGGLTFEPPVMVSNVVEPPDLPEYYRTPTIPSSATDHSTGSYGGSTYVVWQDARAGHSDILISYSRDRGLTWSTPKKVNNDATINAQFFPFVSVASTGRVDVVFYDRRRDPNDVLMDVYAGISMDGGVTFLNRRITDKQIDVGTGRPFIGDYIGVASLDWAFYPGWCGFVGSDEEVFTEQSLAPLVIVHI